MLETDLFKNFTLFSKFNLNPLIFAIETASFDISMPIPVELFNSSNKLRIIHPDPVPISRIDIFFP